MRLLLEFGLAFGVAMLARWLWNNSVKPRDDRNRVPCDRCAELILPEAKVCRYCGAERIVIRARD